MKHLHTLSAGLCGLVAGLGLLLSGMAQPAKVLGFLDVAGAWDPSLALVMIAAIAVASPGYALVRRYGRFEGQPVSWPDTRTIDPPLLAGSALFGIGWGLVGFCPGPALVSLLSAQPAVLIFTGSMLVGMLAHSRLNR